MNNKQMYQNNNNPFINNLMQLLGLGTTPQQIIQNAIAQNPQLQQTFSQMQQNNITPRDMCIQIAQQRGINLNQMVQFMNQRGFRI